VETSLRKARPAAGQGTAVVKPENSGRIDIKDSAAGMSFTQSKIADRGTANPIVSRLTLQIFNILDQCNLPQQTRDGIKGSFDERGSIPLTEYFPFRQTTPTSNTVENFASDVVESDSHPFRFLVFCCRPRCPLTRGERTGRSRD
jgi:hypothetical protein